MFICFKFGKQSDRLHMHRMREHVHRPHFFYLISVFSQILHRIFYLVECKRNLIVSFFIHEIVQFAVVI